MWFIILSLLLEFHTFVVLGHWGKTSYSLLGTGGWPEVRTVVGEDRGRREERNYGRYFLSVASHFPVEDTVAQKDFVSSTSKWNLNLYLWIPSSMCFSRDYTQCRLLLLLVKLYLEVFITGVLRILCWNFNESVKTWQLWSHSIWNHVFVFTLELIWIFRDTHWSPSNPFAWHNVRKPTLQAASCRLDYLAPIQKF